MVLSVKTIFMVLSVKGIFMDLKQIQKFLYWVKLNFMDLKQIEKFLYWLKLNFHGSETKVKKSFTESSQFFNTTSKVKLEFPWLSNKTQTCKVIIHLRTMKNTLSLGSKMLKNRWKSPKVAKNRQKLLIFSWFWVFFCQSKVFVGWVMNW